MHHINAEDASMEINTLRLFLQTAKRLSFKAVAEDNQINPSSVSRTISALETELGVRLFHRTTRRMILTEAGNKFLFRATNIIEEMEIAHEEALSHNTGPIGTLKMTASVSFGERMILPLLPQFRERYPKVALEMVFTDKNLDFATEGIDLGVRLAAELKGSMIATKLIDTRYHVCASPGYLEKSSCLNTPKDLTKHSCLLFTMPAFRSSWLFRGAKGTETRVPISGNISLTSALNLRTAALSGLGPTLLPDWLIRGDIIKGDLIDVFPKHVVTATTFDTAAWLVYPSKNYLPLKVRVMIDYLKTNVPALVNKAS